jgi:23S rRNA (cytosine1962-C5)-methyltransferase
VFPADQYQLLDFGQGRKLERFGNIMLDRPAPVVQGIQPAFPELWKSAHARYERRQGDQGEWRLLTPVPESWSIAHDPFRLELRLTPFGHVGIFAEQATNWDWIATQVRRAGRPLRVLNLFAYTGASTLAAAAAGAEVAHVDAAANTVAWARRNAELSGLAAAPVRWIVEDALKFARREAKRGRRYDAVVLDPPTYGHGPKGEPWKLPEHLLPLLQLCGELTREHRAFVLLTCHSPGVGPAELSASLADGVFGHCSIGATASQLWLATADGRRLQSGAVARWPG